MDASLGQASLMLTIAIIFAVFMGLIVGLLGGGGSILTVPLLVYIVALPTKTAIATALFVVGITSGVSAGIHALGGNIRIKAGLGFAAFAMCGSYLGGRSAHYFADWLLLVLFAFLILSAAYVMLRPPKWSQGDRSEQTNLAAFILPGIIVGFSTGLVGAGGGFLFVPALVLLGGLPMKAAVGTSTLITAVKSFSGLAGQLSHTHIEWTLAASITGAAIVGTVIGSKLVDKLPSATLRRGFGYFVLAMALFILVKELAPQLMTRF